MINVRRVLIPLFMGVVAIFSVTGTATMGEAGPIYNVNRTVGQGSIIGTIETSGVTGVLTAADIIDWDLTLNADANQATTGMLFGPNSGNNSQINFLIGTALTASSTALFFDFVGPTSLQSNIFQITTPGMASVVWQLQSGGSFNDELIREVRVGPNNTVVQTFATHPIGVQMLATRPVPEPTTVALLGIGLVGLAGVEVRRRRKMKAVVNS